MKTTNENKRLLPYSLDDVAKHHTTDDCWVALNGWVLDITHFFPLHPGGAEILLDHLGKDVSKVFKDPDVHIHSVASNNLLKKFRIGYLKGVVSEEDVRKANEETLRPGDYGIDLEKGLVWQTAQLGDDYVDFIERTFVATEKVSLRYFDNPVLEAFSKSPWYVVPFLWVPIFTVVVYWALNGVAWTKFPFYMGMGVVFWMLMEYVLHRFIFHMKTNTFFWNLIHFCLHGYHHIAPMDPYRLTFPPVPALLIGIIVYNFFILFFNFGITMSLLAGMITGYMLYDLEHYALHHNAFLNTFRHFRNMKKHHLYHHYKNENSNFGISSMLFDYVFQSFDTMYLKNYEN